MISKRVSALICISLAMLLQGCAETNSGNIATSGLYADMKVTVDADGKALVSVSLQVGGGLSATGVELSDGDTLTASLDSGTPVLLGKKGVSFAGDTRYETTFSGVTGGEIVTISMNRQNYVNAPDSTITVPAGFSISSPTNNEAFNSGSSVLVGWTNNCISCDVDLEFELDCDLVSGSSYVTYKYFMGQNDDGTFSHSVNNFLSGIPDPVSCATDLVLTRSQSGLLDPNFGEGGITSGRQERVVGFTILPF